MLWRIRNTEPIEKLAGKCQNFRTIQSITTNLENHYNDMQDVEFTIEKDGGCSKPVPVNGRGCD